MNADDILADRAAAIRAVKGGTYAAAARQAARELRDVALAWSVGEIEDDGTAEAELDQRAQALRLDNPALGYSQALRRVMASDRTLAHAYSAGEPWRAATSPRLATQADMAAVVRATKVAHMNIPARFSIGPIMPLRIA